MSDKIDTILQNAILEDIPTIDITTDYLLTNQTSEALFIANENGVISGVAVTKRLFQLIDLDVYFKVINGDGSIVEKGNFIAVISGKTSSILKGEQIAINIMQRMSGIASLTKKYVDHITNKHTKILDTRYTTPNFRFLEKLAVVHGGGINHRMSLSDQVLINNQHIRIAGSISNAVERVKDKIDHNVGIEVMVETFDEYLEAQNTICDMILLHNMSNDLMRKCVEHNYSKKLIEASGNVAVDYIQSISETGVDFISVPAITNSYIPLDISLKFN